MTQRDSFWPTEWEPGLIKTTNVMGLMYKELSPSSKAFVDYAKHAEAPLLDVGAAYGVATIAALESGAPGVIACDLSEEHLFILCASTPKALLSKLTTVLCKFPYDLTLDAQSLSAINLSNVLHFMDGNSILDSLHACWRWLKPGGKLFITVVTTKNYPQVLPEYTKRVKAGIKWPGIFKIDFLANSSKGILPEYMHLFELESLRDILEEAHFSIDTIEYFCYKNYPPHFKQEGNEFLSVSATKVPFKRRFFPF